MILSIQNLLLLSGYVVVGALVAYPLLKYNIRFSQKWGLIDWPKARGVAEDHIPLVGHSIVLLSLLSIIVLDGGISENNIWLLLTASAIAFMGFADDQWNLGAFPKLLIQLGAVMVFVHFDPSLQQGMVAKFGVWGEFWAAIFIVSLTNAVNFIDGIDGLAGLVIGMGCLGLVVLDPALGPSSLLGCLIMGMIIPFLYFNVLKRHGFLGNVGSYFFAYLLATKHLALPIAAHDPISRVCISALCFLIPVSDSIMVVMTRLYSLRSPLAADKGHLHHRLIQTSVPLRLILLNFGLIEICAVAISYMVGTTSTGQNTILPIVLCVSHVGITAILILMIEKSSRRRIQHYIQRLDNGEPIYFMKYVLTWKDGRPLSIWHMARMESMICSEVRVTDLCFSEGNILFVTVRTGPHPLTGMSRRLDQILEREGVSSSLVVEQGELMRVVKEDPSVLEKKKISA